MLKLLIILLTSLILLLTSFSNVSAQVVINEFSVNPQDKQDWVEIYSSQLMDITGWMIGDEAGVFETVTDNGALGPNLYYVASQYQRLNNDKDTIFLYDQNMVVIDSIKYGYEGEVCVPSFGGSIARIPDGANLYDRVSNHTKGLSNGSEITDPCPSPTPQPTETPTPTPKPTPTTKPTPTPKPTSSSTPTNTPTPKPTVKAAQVSESVTEVQEPETNQEEKTLGITNAKNEEDSSAEAFESNVGKKFPIAAGVIIILGLGLIGMSLRPFLKITKKGYNQD